MPQFIRSLLITVLLATASTCCGEVVEPISVFLTIEEDPSTSMGVRWLTKSDNPNDKLEYREIGFTDWKTVTGTHVPMPDEHPYLIHHVLLTELKPGTDYFFRFGEKNKTLKFRTLPSSLQEPIRFVVGGDMLHDLPEYFIRTNKKAAATQPMFAVLGGDIAYSAPKNKLEKENVNRWIAWLKIWSETMVTDNGRTIPILVAIGNHDVIGRYDKTPAEAKYFYALFKSPTLGGYQVVDFSDYLSFWILDSDHTHPVSGKQSEWLNKTLKERKDIRHKFAAYHVPAYPSVRDPNKRTSKQIREKWSPLFSEYGLKAAFEHHDHTYKRTYPIYNDKIDYDKGVLYLGDGAWGMKEPRIPKKPCELWYLAKTQSTRHFILVTIDGLKRSYTAISPEGNIIDNTNN